MRTKHTAHEVEKRMRSMKALILDGDGVWFTGHEFRGVLPDGTAVVFKSRHHHDGQGVSFMRALGIKILFATAEGEPMGSVVQKLNNLPSVKDGTWEPLDALVNLQKKGTKVESVEAWITSNGLTWEDCAYMGDDRTDWECMQRAGLTVAPGNALPYIKDIADVVVEKLGGAGAIREFTDMVLRARGRSEWEFPAA